MCKNNSNTTVQKKLVLTHFKIKSPTKLSIINHIWIILNWIVWNRTVIKQMTDVKLRC